MTSETLAEISAALDAGLAVPYLGPGVLALAGSDCPLPGSPEALVARLTAKASVPHKIRKNLTAAAQFIENFKHRKTVTAAMTGAFRSDVPPTALHGHLASLPALPLLVQAWYDDLMQKALAGRADWGLVQGLSQAEHFGRWVGYFDPQGQPVEPDASAAWRTLVYQPLGSVSPSANFLVSDSDFVEVLTEIDIQTPIPEPVKSLRRGRHFLFLGCRFASQLERIFAQQIIKRSSDRHWAVLPEEPTRNEARFLARHNIERLAIALPQFLDGLQQLDRGKAPAELGNLVGAAAIERQREPSLGRVG
jgi:hypothetical protein